MRKIALAMVMLLLLTMTAGAQSLSYIQMSLLNQNPDPARAGDVVEVRLRLQNLGDAELNDVRVEYIPEYPFSILAGQDTTQTIASLPNWPAEENSKTLIFKIRVDRDALLGQYPVSFRNSLGDEAVGTLMEFTLDLTAREFAEIIYIDQTKLMPGRETPMTFTINNIGNAPLQNLVFSWDESNGYVLPVSTDNTRYIKYLGPGESVPLEFTVVASVNANPDLYQLDLKLEYDLSNGTGGTVKETVITKAGIFIGGETDFDVTFSESTQGQTTLSVANVGSNPALSVTVRIPRQQGFQVAGNRDAIIGNLDKGDYTIVSFQITPRTGETGEHEGAQGTDRFRERFAEGSNLDVVIDYTDTTGIRRSLEKTVSIQFRSSSTTEGGAGPHSGGRQQKSLWKSPWVIGIAFLTLGFVLYRKRTSILGKMKR